jgi:protein Mpv17
MCIDARSAFRGYVLSLLSLILYTGAVIVFFGSMALLEGKPKEIVPRIGAVSDAADSSSVLRADIFLAGLRTDAAAQLVGPSVLSFSIDNSLSSRAVFVPTQIINFWLVPPHLRFVVVSVVSLFWSRSFESAIYLPLIACPSFVQIPTSA